MLAAKRTLHTRPDRRVPTERMFRTSSENIASRVLEADNKITRETTGRSFDNIFSRVLKALLLFSWLVFSLTKLRLV